MREYFISAVIKTKWLSLIVTMTRIRLFCRFAALKRRQTEHERPLYKEGVAASIAVTGDCLPWEYDQKQSSASLSLGTSFEKEAAGLRKPSL